MSNRLFRTQALRAATACDPTPGLDGCVPPAMRRTGALALVLRGLAALRVGITALLARNRSATPVLLQSEVAECGLCAVLMVAARHGRVISLVNARSRLSVSPRGSTLAQLIAMARTLGMAPRPLRVEPAGLHRLALPCVLHWDFSHFVVLTHVTSTRCTIHDPAIGRRELTLDELSRSFTGVALELLPGAGFVREKSGAAAWYAQAWATVRGLRGELARLLMLSALLQGLLVLAPLQIQWLMDDVVASGRPPWIMTLGIGFGALVVLQAAVTAARGWMVAQLGARMNLQLQADTLQHLVRLPLAWFLRRRNADVISRLGSVDAIHRTLAGGVIETLVDGVMLVLSLAMMVRISPGLALVPVGAALLVAWIRHALQAGVQAAEETVLVRGARRIEHLMETLRGMQTVKLAAQEQARVGTAGRLAIHELNGELHAARWRLLGQTLSTLVLGLENVISLSLAAQALMARSSPTSAFTVGMVFAFLAYKGQFLQRSAGVLERLGEFRLLSVHFHRLADITAAPPEQVPPPGPTALAVWDVDVKGLAFRFGDGDPLLFDDLNLRVADGQCVAIVGPSGSGKTTLLKLMLGLLEPSRGDIRIGGRSLVVGCPPDVRSGLGTVMQDDILFSGSIGQNIAFFDTDADEAHVEACARLVGLHDEIAAMPMGYRSLIGDAGNALSGGQRQRLLLARALYRRPRVLFLDEATSHLDPLAEQRIGDAVRSMGITRIIVAHRPTTIASADQVWRLEGGKLRRSSALETLAAAQA